MKVMKSEKKETVQGTNDDGRETGTQSNGLDQDEERIIQKNEERLRNLQDIFKHSNIWIIGVPEGEEEEQKLKSYLNK